MDEEILNNLDVAHQSTYNCQKKAKIYLYWKNITTDIKDFVKSFKICQKYQKYKEAMIP